MGTEVHFKSYAPVCYSVNDRNKNANGGSWPKCYKDKALTAGNYYEPFLQMQTTDEYSESDKEELKRAMLKQEVIFRNQVHELHRLYGIQKDFMDELKRNELHKPQGPVGAFQSSRIPSEDVQNSWRYSRNQLAGSTCHASTSSLINCRSQQPTSKNGSVKIDLQLPADEYLAREERWHIGKEENTCVSVDDGYPSKKYCRIESENDTNDRDPSCQGFKRDLADLNEEFHVEEATTDVRVDVTDPASFHREKHENLFSKPKSVFVGLSMEYLHNSWRGRDDRMYINIQHVENKDGWHGLDIHAHQSDSSPQSSSVSSWTNPKGMDLNLAPSGGLEVGMIPQQDFVIPNFGRIFGFPIVDKVPGSKGLPSEVPEAQYSAKLGNMFQTISNPCAKEEEEEVLLKTRTHDMDLEVPVYPDASEDVVTMEDSLRNELEKRTPQKLENVNWMSMEASVRDPLRWFAEVATSTTGDLESKRCVNDDDKLSCGMDYFESMTLKLTETKADEYEPRSSVPDSPKEVTNVSSLMNKHCRGKGRRGGQQRNFQRDVLPGFASLTKHEVSEDLEMLEGLMRSMGHSWQIGAARKNAAKNGRAKGRR